MANVTGIAITIKAFLPTGKTIDEQFAALSLVKQAHETGDYSSVLAAANIDEVKSEQKTRRMDDEPQAEQSEAEQASTADPLDQPAPADDEDVPDFLKKEKKGKAA